MTKDTVVIDSPKDPVVSDSVKDPIVSDSVKDPVVSDSTKDPVVNDSKKKPSRYRPKPKKEKKQKKEKWLNNKKVKWSDDTKPPTLPTHLLPPKSDPRIKGIPAAVEAELQTYLERAQVQTTDNDGDDDDNDYDTTVQVEDVINDNADVDDADYGELVNNEFLSPFDQEIGPTGATIIHDGVLFAQYSDCHR